MTRSEKLPLACSVLTRACQEGKRRFIHECSTCLGIESTPTRDVPFRDLDAKIGRLLWIIQPGFPENFPSLPDVRLRFAIGPPFSERGSQINTLQSIAPIQ